MNQSKAGDEPGEVTEERRNGERRPGKGETGRGDRGEAKRGEATGEKRAERGEQRPGYACHLATPLSPLAVISLSLSLSIVSHNSRIQTKTYQQKKRRRRRKKKHSTN